MSPTSTIRKPAGKLGVLIPGMGAVGTTFIAGALLARKGLAAPIGSLTQMGSLKTPDGPVRINEHLPLAGLNDLVFGGWDLFADDALTTARRADVIRPAHLDLVADELAALKPMPAVFFPEFVRRLRGENVKTSKNKMELAEAVREDIRRFKRDNDCERTVAIWCGSTEAHRAPTEVHDTVESFEKGLRESSPAISPSQVYCYACLMEGVAYANGAPNLTEELPCMRELSKRMHAPLAGKDFKTGQTLMKTILAPGLRARQLGVRGWFSTNILGNRDGEVLDDPENFKTKELSKLGVLESILEPELHPELYGDMHHQVRINYYPPRGDQKEGWDNIDIFGWLGYPMQIKIDFLCRDSILAAPLVLDLALLLDLAQRSGLSDVQRWLGFFFKSPTASTVNDLFAQEMELRQALQSLAEHGASVAKLGA
ncbi:MAG: inositol-3-phosphate synthase [Myxococcota bacterium]